MQHDDPPLAYLEKLLQKDLEIKALKKEISQIRKEQMAGSKLEKKFSRISERFIQSQKRFRTIFEQSRLGNKILNSDLKILEVNPALVAMLGYTSKEDLLGRKIIEFSDPGHIERWQTLQKSLWENKIPSFSIEACLVRKDSSKVWCRVTSILFEDDGSTLGFTIIEDIDKKKRLEEKNQRLYDNQELMVNIVAHDLKNPIHNIYTLSILLQNSLGTLGKEALFRLSLIKQACERCYTIIDDLNLIGEVENGEFEMHPSNVGDLLLNVTKQMEAVALEKGVSLVLEVKRPKAAAHIDKAKIARVFENLFSNAVKFSKNGGEIKIILDQADSFVTIAVIDKGIGIPAALQPIIFNKFTKAKRKGTLGEPTTGLGLFISKRIMESHNGKLWFESEPGEGATFYISLPSAEETQ